MQKVWATKGCISLAGGRPLDEVFPSICGEPPDSDLMNYGPNLARGHPKAIKWAKEFVEWQHPMPCGWEKHDLIMMPGATNSIAMMIQLCTDAGDKVLCEDFTYTGFMAAAKPLGRIAVGVAMDEEGLLPSDLRRTCASLAADGKAPRLLYLVPTGQNPTAITMPAHRRREIYKVAQEHNLLIVEDDPYFHLSLGPAQAQSEADMRGLTPVAAELPSFLSLDTDGRVCRLDSCSKILAPGFRLCWLTAAKAIVEKLGIMGEVLVWAMSGFTQKAFLQCQHDLGRDGMHSHLQKMQWAYRQRRDWCIQAFEQHLTGLARWDVPQDGMFMWLEILGLDDAGQLAEPLVERGVAMVPGAAFLADSFSRPCSMFRVSFSMLTKETAMEAAERLAAALRDTEFLGKHELKRDSRSSENEPAQKMRKLE
mmetsp:Transcript_18619/g.30201  ORF Transcript_18619/g.30201 Transcript_18619/m.30201 type:complete len:423 (-) Transcript_18619:68-1336(-)